MLITKSFDRSQLTAAHGGTILAHAGLPDDPAIPFGSAFGCLLKGMVQERMVQGPGGKLYVPLHGSAVIVSAGRTYRIQPGDVVVFPPGTDHEVHQDGADDFENFCLWWPK